MNNRFDDEKTKDRFTNDWRGARIPNLQKGMPKTTVLLKVGK